MLCEAVVTGGSNEAIEMKLLRDRWHEDAEPKIIGSGQRSSQEIAHTNM
jgi:hypothetical protein